MIAIVDYGAGNLKSVLNAFRALGENPSITQNPADLHKAAAIILPGVGAFGDGMGKLRQLELYDALQDAVIGGKVPFLGICLGLQFTADRSFEMGEFPGLGWIKGEVQLIVPQNGKFRVPHMGWNNIEILQEAPLFKGLEEDPVFYFVHSYYLHPAESDKRFISSTVYHGADLTASLQKDNIFAVQFHPEKSQQNGIKVLNNFLELI